MKKYLNTAICTAAMCIFLCLAVACGKSTSYRDDIPVGDIGALLRTRVAEPEGLKSYDAEDVEFNIGVSAGDYTSFEVCVQTNGASVEEYGVFHTAGGKAERLEKKLMEYLSKSVEGKTDWLRSYNPSQAELLADGKVYRYGNYVIYEILPVSVQNSVNSDIKLMLDY